MQDISRPSVIILKSAYYGIKLIMPMRRDDASGTRGCQTPVLSITYYSLWITDSKAQ